MVALIWGKADNPFPAEEYNPLDFGWVEEDNYFVPLWHSGPVLPSVVAKPSRANEEPAEPLEDEFQEDPELADDAEAEWSESSEEEE